MSSHVVEVVEIDDISSHPNADRLDICSVKGWQCIVQKDRYSKGDKVLYIPIDSILPNEVEVKLFGPDSKVKLHHSRVKTIKLRGAISQGMVADLEMFNLQNKPVGYDATKELNITKYEPPEHSVPQTMKAGSVSHKQTNPYFRKYGGIENAKNYNRLFQDGEIVSVTEKLHGSNTRAGYVPFHAVTLWQKTLQFLRLAPKYQFVYGSNNVQLQNKKYQNTFIPENVYLKIAKLYKLEERLKPGEVVYGEVIGDGIQKNYSYGCKPGEHKLVIFDVMIDGEYLDPTAFKHWAKERGFETAPVLYVGPYDHKKILDMTKGDSVYCKSQKVREGVVVKSIKEEKCHIGRKMLKFISDEYLLKDNTDFH